MIRRGLTMVELLVSLVLLSIATAAAVGWLRIATAHGVVEADTIRWRAAAARAIQRVEEAIVIGDFDPNERVPHVVVEDGGLRIRSRETPFGRVTHLFAIDARTNELQRTSDRRDTRLLLGDVDRWDVEISTDGDDPGRRWLNIAVERKSKPDVIARRLRLP